MYIVYSDVHCKCDIFMLTCSNLAHSVSRHGGSTHCFRGSKRFVLKFSTVLVLSPVLKKSKLFQSMVVLGEKRISLDNSFSWIYSITRICFHVGVCVMLFLGVLCFKTFLIFM